MYKIYITIIYNFVIYNIAYTIKRNGEMMDR